MNHGLYTIAFYMQFQTRPPAAGGHFDDGFIYWHGHFNVVAVMALTPTEISDVASKVLPAGRYAKKLLEVEGLWKAFDDGRVQAVANLSLSAGSGEVVGLVGPNGAGKTTAIRCICGIMRADKGQVTMDGKDIRAVDSNEALEARRILGFVPEVPAPYENLTVWDHLEMIAQAYSLPESKWRPRAEELLDLFDMREKRHEVAMRLSKGMRQKILIMCALLHEPRVLFLDEPLIGIDPKGARALKDQVRRLAASGSCVVVSSHILSLVEELCSRVAVMVKGVIVAEGTVEELRRRARLKEGATLEDAFLAVTAESGEK